ncbi:MAG: rod-binding protein [Phycisphaerales bacterium]|nr:rod-binding protein [Phycisphaerales bacterium]
MPTFNLPTSAIAAPNPETAALASRPHLSSDDQKAFTQIMGREVERMRGKPDPAKTREAAENFVAIALVQPIFKQLRSTNNAVAPFAPTKAEQQFQSMIDAQLAQKMVKSSNWPLVDRLAQDMLKKAMGTAAPTPGTEELSLTP